MAAVNMNTKPVGHMCDKHLIKHQSRVALFSCTAIIHHGRYVFHLFYFPFWIYLCPTAIYAVYTSPSHPPIPNHMPTLIVTPHGQPFSPNSIHLSLTYTQQANHPTFFTRIYIQTTLVHLLCPGIHGLLTRPELGELSLDTVSPGWSLRCQAISSSSSWTRKSICFRSRSRLLSFFSCGQMRGISQPQVVYRQHGCHIPHL